MKEFCIMPTLIQTSSCKELISHFQAAPSDLVLTNEYIFTHFFERISILKEGEIATLHAIISDILGCSSDKEAYPVVDNVRGLYPSAALKPLIFPQVKCQLKLKDCLTLI